MKMCVYQPFILLFTHQHSTLRGGNKFVTEIANNKIIFVLFFYALKPITRFNPKYSEFFVCSFFYVYDENRVNDTQENLSIDSRVVDGEHITTYVHTIIYRKLYTLFGQWKSVCFVYFIVFNVLISSHLYTSLGYVRHKNC